MRNNVICVVSTQLMDILGKTILNDKQFLSIVMNMIKSLRVYILEIWMDLRKVVVLLVILLIN